MYIVSTTENSNKAGTR